MTWPNYSPACIRAVKGLLQAGGSLSAYRANPQVGVEPRKDSWAWRLEREIEKRFKVKHAVAVNSGTAGLHAALVGAGITSGEVITSPFTFSATISAIVLAGATPVFADVDPYTFTISPDTVKGLVNKRTRCILPVDLFGGLAPFEGVDYHGTPIIRDSCQAVGAVRNGTYSGTDALAAAYSFNGGKQVPAGEAGALVTNSDKVAHHARLLMNHAENFGAKWVGYNYRPTEVTACVAWHGLQELEERNKRRRDLANALHRQFVLETVGPIRGQGYVQIISKRHGLVYTPPHYGSDHALYVYPFTVQHGRERFCKRMEKRGIPVGRGYIQPTLNHYPAFRKYQRTPLPVVEELSKKTLCILSTLTPDRPLYYADTVAKAMRESLR